MEVSRSVDSPDLSDIDDETWDPGAPELTGTLNKWTNYIHGWQQRFIALKDGTLVYYKSANETDFGCRGAISIQKAVVTPHEFDELRFDVSVNDCVWYLRASNLEDRERWVVALEAYKVKSEPDSASVFSAHSTSSKGCKGLGLNEKLAEMETFRDILCRQIDTLQSYFDACSDIADVMKKTGLNGVMENGEGDQGEVSRNLMRQHGLHNVDFKGEAITFKATTTGILSTLGYCIELMGQREDQWKRRLEREVGARKAAEERLQCAAEQHTSPRNTDVAKSPRMKGGPDYEEGPHSQIGEEEFFDAVESALDKLEEELEKKEQLKSLVEEKRSEAVSSGASQHRLWPEIERTTQEQLKYARMSVEPGSGVWELFAEDGEMKMYKREEMVDGMVVDPLKALHTVQGVTAKELCHYFFSPDVRCEWEHTIETMSVLEEVSDDTLIFLQLHKRIWPAAQRDALFWSHMRRVDTGAQDPDVTDTWIVCNKSCEHVTSPSNVGGCLRVDLTVCFVAQTVLAKGDKNDRKNISCRITYCSVVNPGGWAPASVLRTVYKREYPRFLKRFTQYVIDKTKDLPVMWD